MQMNVKRDTRYDNLSFTEYEFYISCTFAYLCKCVGEEEVKLLFLQFHHKKILI